MPEENEELRALLSSWSLDTDTDKRNGIVLTEYHEVEKMTNGLAIKW